MYLHFEIGWSSHIIIKQNCPQLTCVDNVSPNKCNTENKINLFAFFEFDLYIAITIEERAYNFDRKRYLEGPARYHTDWSYHL